MAVDRVNSTRCRSTLAALCLLALALRGGVAWQRRAELSQDRDAYLGIAASIAEGRGYSSPGSTRPTAYRPPLYPLVLAACPVRSEALWVATLNLCSGAAVVWVTAILGLRLGLGFPAALMAAGIVAVDPLLVRYASQPMTESVCTLLVAALVLSCDVERLHQGVWRSAVAGVLFGLCALCRPTVWAFGGGMLMWGLVEMLLLRKETASRSTCPTTFDIDRRLILARTAAGLLGCLLVVGPWVLRNQRALGHPVLTTTHGGYTLLLGNNPAFYAEVVRQPWGTVWDGRVGGGQQAWVDSVEREMAAAGVDGEVDRDRWMSARARAHMREDPTGLLQASLLRQVRFWQVVPSGEAAAGWPRGLLWGVGTFYILQWLLVIAGGIRVCVKRDVRWAAALLMIVSFAMAHLLYWSNARMRAPLVPMLALLAVYGWLGLGLRRQSAS